MIRWKIIDDTQYVFVVLRVDPLWKTLQRYYLGEMPHEILDFVRENGGRVRYNENFFSFFFEDAASGILFSLKYGDLV